MAISLYLSAPGVDPVRIQHLPHRARHWRPSPFPLLPDSRSGPGPRYQDFLRDGAVRDSWEDARDLPVDATG
ncbi:hypothetical protein GCM10025867_36460 [Frondihabitans sucicola]|uniref:Uncharacterized protein n=1 Tax=Frondihabitans sucicola TaxID=1268041 RepID=A0ABN6Y659_9MICO|nr:hypothetical protein [Frondihabitans sucicola]BDZ51405.1 hypothetical protein GCM10025867_36460 [Frondihabitans sucicola]